MQGLMEVIGLYGLGAHPPSKVKPTPHHSAQQLVGSLLGRGKINAFCATRIACFMFSDETLAVLSRDAIQCLSCDGHSICMTGAVANPCSGELAMIAATNTKAIVASSASINFLGEAQSQEYDGGYSGAMYGVLCVTAVPDGSYYATGSRGGTVTVWTSNLEPLHILSGHADWVRFVKFAAGPSAELQLFSTGDDGSIILWDPIDGARLSRLEYTGGTAVQVFEVNFYSGLMAVAYNSPILALYRCRSDRSTHQQGDDVLRLQQINLITGAHRAMLTAAKFTNDAQWIASAGEDETLAVSSVVDPHQIYVCHEFVTRRHCLTFMNTFSCICILASPPASSVIVLAACASDGTVVEWVVDPRNNRTSYTKKLQVHLGTLLSMDVLRRVPT